MIALGIDVGGTNTKFGLADQKGNISFQSRVKTQNHATPQALIEAVANEVQKEILFEQLEGIGVGAPNANYYTGNIENAPNLPFKGVVPFADIINRIFGRKVIITNDANASALGEMVFGKAKNMRDFVVFTVGTGLGGGIITNGELVYGKHGFAGELGHTLVNANGRHCACGKRGCLETYVSATGIRRTVYKLLADFTEPSPLRQISFNDLSTRTITEAAKEGDKIAIEAFKYTGRVLGMKLADMVVQNDPEAVFVMGGLSQAGKYLFEPAQENFEHFLMPHFKQYQIQILPSGLEGDAAPILGAASLVWKYLIK